MSRTEVIKFMTQAEREKKMRKKLIKALLSGSIERGMNGSKNLIGKGNLSEMKALISLKEIILKALEKSKISKPCFIGHKNFHDNGLDVLNINKQGHNYCYYKTHNIMFIMLNVCHYF